MSCADYSALGVGVLDRRHKLRAVTAPGCPDLRGGPSCRHCPLPPEALRNPVQNPGEMTPDSTKGQEIPGLSGPISRAKVAGALQEASSGRLLGGPDPAHAAVPPAVHTPLPRCFVGGCSMQVRHTHASNTLGERTFSHTADDTSRP